jgi:hypothetical protein
MRALGQKILSRESFGWYVRALAVRDEQQLLH